MDENLQKQLKTVGELIGLAFQVRDDILDVTASFEEIGKTPQKDLQAEKSTYPALLGWMRQKFFVTELWIRQMQSWKRLAN